MGYYGATESLLRLGAEVNATGSVCIIVLYNMGYYGATESLLRLGAEVNATGSVCIIVLYLYFVFMYVYYGFSIMISTICDYRVEFGKKFWGSPQPSKKGSKKEENIFLNKHKNNISNMCTLGVMLFVLDNH